jgi:hypothetical protein
VTVPPMDPGIAFGLGVFIGVLAVVIVCGIAVER